MSGQVELLKQRFKKLDSDFTCQRSTLQEISEYFLPEKATFFGTRPTSAEERMKIFDSTPEEVLQTLAAALQSLLTPPDQDWFSLSLVLNNGEVSETVKEWLDAVVKIIMAEFNSEEGGFHSAVHEFWMDLPALATAVFYVDELQGIRFKCISLSEVRIAENAKGVIDTVYRVFEFSVRQILEIWPDSASAEIKRLADTEPDKKFRIVHAVEPRKNFKPGSKKSKELPFKSIYFEETTNKILSESGYEESCYMVARWSKTSGQSYGRGPGHKALPDARVLNEMSRSEMIAIDKASDPTTLLPHDGFVTEWSSDGGSTNYHRATGDIREKVMVIGSDADLVAIRNAIVSKQDAIKRLFLNHKLQMVGGPQKTAEEVREIVKQFYIILGPVAGRLQTEFLAPLVHRVFSIKLRNGEFPPVPEELQGQDLKVRYVSPITRAQKQTGADAVMQTFQFLAPFAAVAPHIYNNFDFNEMARDTHEFFGYAAKYLKSPDRMKKEAQAEQAAMQKQQAMVEQSQQLALAKQAKDLKPNEQ
jgi:hypothetical protein